MAITGTKIPVKNCKIELSTGMEFPCTNVDLTAKIDLVESSDNASGGHVERIPCFSDSEADLDADWRALGVGLAVGQSVNLIVTVVATTVVVTLTGMLVENIKLTGKAKDVWKVRVSLKGNQTTPLVLPAGS